MTTYSDFLTCETCGSTVCAGITHDCPGHRVRRASTPDPSAPVRQVHRMMSVEELIVERNGYQATVVRLCAIASELKSCPDARSQELGECFEHAIRDSLDSVSQAMGVRLR